MNRLFTYGLLGLFCMSFLTVRPQFAPPAGQAGTDAIHVDSNVFIGWAIGCDLQRGWVQAGNAALGLASFGDPANAVGKADNVAVSLGDGGSAVLTFTYPLRNGVGPDFAVFENSFSDDFLELAFVEVSSNGVDFFRFPSVSLSPTDQQVGTFGSIDATKIDLLAGKYRAYFGVPFDLELLKHTIGLNIDSITHIRIVDVVGSIDPTLGSRDSGGRLINDPWPTPFPSSGFDLDAIGVIHDRRNLSLNKQEALSWDVFPNPTNDILFVRIMSSHTEREFRLINAKGKLYFSELIANGLYSFSLQSLPPGLYFVEVRDGQQTYRRKIVKQ